jgi:hypothetical protein
MNIPIKQINYISTPTLFSNILKGSIALSFFKESIDEADWVEYYNSHEDLYGSFSPEDSEALKYHYVHNGIFEGRMINTFPDHFLWLGKPKEFSNQTFVIGSLLNPYEYSIECFINLNSKFTSIRDHTPELFLEFLRKSGPYETLLQDSNIYDQVKFFFKPQSYFFFDENNNNVTNFLIRSDRFEKDNSFLQDLIQLESHPYTRDLIDISKYITSDDHWNLIKDIYRSDFDNFGYER